METLALLCAGLGFFFIGLGGLKTHLQQLANRKFRRMLGRWMRIPGLSAAAGFFFGAITQSATAVAFIMAGFVSGGLIPLAKALSIVGWANLGTVLLVFVAAIDVKIAALYMIGVSAIAVTFNIAGRHKAFLYSLYSVGLLFFGLRTMREAFALLPEFEWFPPVIAAIQSSEIVGFFAGAMLRLFIQSSSAIVVLAITLCQSGILTETQAVFFTVGTGLGVAVAGLFLSSHLRGVPRQIVLFQIINNAIASVAAMLLCLLPPTTEGPGMLTMLFPLVPGGISAHIATSYLVLNSLGLFSSLLTAPFAPTLLAKLSPVTDEEDVATPQFLLDEAISDPETAVELVEREQRRLFSLIPLLLASSRAGAMGRGGAGAKSEYTPLCRLSSEIRSYLAEVLNQGLPPGIAERVLVLERRQTLLESLGDNTHRMAAESQAASGHPAVKELESTLVESLDGVFLIATDALASSDPLDKEILLAMTSDRGEMMRSTRSTLLSNGTELLPEQRNALFNGTSSHF